MLREFELRVHISLPEAAKELAASGDLIAIGHFLRILGAGIDKLNEEDSLRSNAKSNLSFNLQLAVSKLASDLGLPMSDSAVLTTGQFQFELGTVSGVPSVEQMRDGREQAGYLQPMTPARGMGRGRFGDLAKVAEDDPAGPVSIARCRRSSPEPAFRSCFSVNAWRTR